MSKPKRKARPERAQSKKGAEGRSSTGKRPARGNGRASAPARGAGRAKKLTRKNAARKKTSTHRKAHLKPIVGDETETLLHLEELLSHRIFGKEEAIRKVANAIRIRRAKLDFRPSRPDGAFLIAGPSGVGKTEFACAVAEVLMGSDNRVVLLDMADYTEEEDIEDLLVTIHPEVEGMLIQGTLTTPVRSNPRSVILLRGLEKADPSLRRVLLHILDRGTLTDAQGEVRFNHTILFVTTRLKPEETDAREPIGFKRSSLTREERWRRFLEEQFGSELVAAFNEVLYFDQLTAQEVRLIARYKVNTVLERLRRQKRGVEVSDQVFETFIRDDEVQRRGARDLNRTLEEKIFTPLSKYLLSHSDAREIRVDIQGGRVVIQDASS